MIKWVRTGGGGEPEGLEITTQGSPYTNYKNSAFEYSKQARLKWREAYLQNSHKFENLGTGATEFNDSSIIREPLISLKLYNFDFSDFITGPVCIALWRCQFEFRLAAPQFFFSNKGALNSGVGH